MYDRSFVPSAGDFRLTPFYHATVALLTCERTWRRAFIRQISAEPRDVILDVGCGNGALAIALKKTCPSASIYGMDSDPDALIVGESRARDADVLVHFSKADALHMVSGAVSIRPNKIVSSFVLHQIPVEDKLALLRGAFASLRAGGEIHIADYGEQKSALMRMAFRQVQAIDGAASTQSNADGVLPDLMEAAGFNGVEERSTIPTPTGSISLYSAFKA